MNSWKDAPWRDLSIGIQFKIFPCKENILHNITHYSQGPFTPITITQGQTRYYPEPCDLQQRLHSPMNVRLQNFLPSALPRLGVIYCCVTTSKAWQWLAYLKTFRLSSRCRLLVDDITAHALWSFTRRYWLEPERIIEIANSQLVKENHDTNQLVAPSLACRWSSKV